ncbi:SPBc2 prophage-derived glycosyltransferase SunS [compost metagenome]
MKMSTFFNIFQIPTITYGITVCNEVNELKKLLTILIPLISKNDEIIILQDVTNENKAVTDLIAQFKSVRRIEAQLNGDFSAFKNTLIKMARKKYLFQIDADEYPQVGLIKGLKLFLWKNLQSDCFLVPRINIVDGITEQDLENWKWKKNEDGYINFPDFQTRILKLNGKIQWKNKVHETLINYNKLKAMPTKNYDFCLIHKKEINRQRNQNAFYDKL